MDKPIEHYEEKVQVALDKWYETSFKKAAGMRGRERELQDAITDLRRERAKVKPKPP